MANSKILYLEANKRDFIETMMARLPGYYVRETDGKIDWIKRPHPNPPWIYVKPGKAMNCQVWHKIIFDAVHNQQKVPIQCHKCWKVVLMPRSLRELMATYLMERKLFRPSKCGIEGDRPNSPRLYGGYFYNQSLDEGLDCYHAIKAELEKKLVYEGNVLEVPVKANFDTDITERLILKRGCTEFEQHCGPSQYWKYDAEQEEIEKIAIDSFSSEVLSLTQSELIISHVIKEWIHKAYQWGDETYKDFTNGNDLFVKCVTYHDLENPHEFLQKAQTGKLEDVKNGKERT